jgi:cobalamin biosynthesis Co2+ chelatase CbiK
MPDVVVQILVHEASIVSGVIIPVRQLAEGAQESINKNYKYLRKFHSRKISRSLKIEDIFTLLLVSSGPFLSSLRRLPKKGYQNIFAGSITTIRCSERIRKI